MIVITLVRGSGRWSWLLIMCAFAWRPYEVFRKGIFGSAPIDSTRLLGAFINCGAIIFAGERSG